ncbi:phospholipid-transporting ATPase domain-containing protein [Vairimorpha necatrix]|uniref:Phospholipid-transporting ATPase domain-containing protein n=1 Tax=Vairimorpha necatrix TaxID=6039 RepID=A0AAX4JEG7_9MICR
MKKFRIINSNTSNFPDNVICNMKYRWYSIIFSVLLNQFEFFYNSFFFLISISQCIEKFAINSPITSLGPWLLVYFINLLKESFDDYKRNERDYNINNQMYTVYRNKQFRNIRSKNIKVGDFIILEKNQRVPADCLLLKTSDQTGQLFLRTDQLDGETDWKLRTAVRMIQKETFIINFKDVKILAEEPNKEIYKFNGVISKEEIDLKGINLEEPRKKGFFDLIKKQEEEEGEVVNEEVYSFITKIKTEGIINKDCGLMVSHQSEKNVLNYNFYCSSSSYPKGMIFFYIYRRENIVHFPPINIVW